MYRDKERYGQNPKTVIRSKEKTFKMPIHLSEPSLIFTCSWSDWFIVEADDWRNEAWQIIKETPQHFYQIFTKRAERINECLPEDWGAGYENVMIVATAENQAMAEKRGAELAFARGSYFGLSLEPLLSEICLSKIKVSVPSDYDQKGNGIEWIDNVPLLSLMDWLVIGGESGNDNGFYRYRPCELDWIEHLVEEGTDASVATFVKQTGTHLAKELKLNDRHGGDISEFPPHLQIRQHPKVIREKFGLLD
jgi:protein gp37